MIKWSTVRLSYLWFAIINNQINMMYDHKMMYNKLRYGKWLDMFGFHWLQPPKQIQQAKVGAHHGAPAAHHGTWWMPRRETGRLLALHTWPGPRKLWQVTVSAFRSFGTCCYQLIIHLSSTYRHFSSTYRPFVFHLSSIYRPSIIHLSSIINLSISWCQIDHTGKRETHA